MELIRISAVLEGQTVDEAIMVVRGQLSFFMLDMSSLRPNGSLQTHPSEIGQVKGKIQSGLLFPVCNMDVQIGSSERLLCDPKGSIDRAVASSTRRPAQRTSLLRPQAMNKMRKVCSD